MRVGDNDCRERLFSRVQHVVVVGDIHVRSHTRLVRPLLDRDGRLQDVDFVRVVVGDGALERIGAHNSRGVWQRVCLGSGHRVGGRCRGQRVGDVRCEVADVVGKPEQRVGDKDVCECVVPGVLDRDRVDDLIAHIRGRRTGLFDLDLGVIDRHVCRVGV